MPLGGPWAPAVARRLAAEGATVVLVATGPEAAEAGRLAAEIEAAGSGRPAVFVGDGPVHGADVAPGAGPVPGAGPGASGRGGGDGLDGLVEMLTELFGGGGGAARPGVSS